MSCCIAAGFTGCRLNSQMPQHLSACVKSSTAVHLVAAQSTVCLHAAVLGSVSHWTHSQLHFALVNGIIHVELCHQKLGLTATQLVCSATPRRARGGRGGGYEACTA